MQHDVDRLDLDAAPVALLQDGANALLVGKRELSGRVRFALRDRDERRCGAFGRRHERILRGAAPDENPQQASLPRCRPQIGEGLDGVVEEHDAESRHDHVEACRLEAVPLRVGPNEACLDALPLGAAPGGRDQRFRDVDPGAVTCCAEASGNGQRGAAGAAADVENPSPRASADRLDEHVLQRLQDPVHDVLHLGPAAPAGPVPHGRLPAIPLVRRFHPPLLISASVSREIQFHFKST